MPRLRLAIEVLDQPRGQGLFDVPIVVIHLGRFPIRADVFSVAIAIDNFNAAIAVYFLSGAFGFVFLHLQNGDSFAPNFVIILVDVIAFGHEAWRH